MASPTTANNLFSLIGKAWNNPVPTVVVGGGLYGTYKGADELLGRYEYERDLDRARDAQSIRQADMDYSHRNLMQMLDRQAELNALYANAGVPMRQQMIDQNMFNTAIDSIRGL